MFTLACSPYSPGVHQPAHAHDDLQITIVLRGSLEERVGATVERATALSVVVKDPGVVHDDRFGTAGALMSIAGVVMWCLWLNGRKDRAGVRVVELHCEAC